MIEEIKRIIKQSEILKYDPNPSRGRRRCRTRCLPIDPREDDSKWPQKNKDGRQELEIRLGNEHISFEV